MTSSGPEQSPNGPAQRDDPGPRSSAAGRSRGGPDLTALGVADLAVAAGTLLYLIFMIVPWYRIDPYDLGSGYSSPGTSANGFDSGMVVVAFILLVLATAWALLPAFVDVPVPSPRALVTVGLAAPALLLTLIEWLSEVDNGFTLMGLLTLASSVAVLALAVLRLLSELRDRVPLPGGLAGAAQLAGRPVPRFGGRGSGAERRPGRGSSPAVPVRPDPHP